MTYFYFYSHISLLLINIIGSILYLRSHLLPHYIGKWTGNRFSIIQYTHQSVFDYYTENANTKEPLFPLAEMPPWYQERYEKEG